MRKIRLFIMTSAVMLVLLVTILIGHDALYETERKKTYQNNIQRLHDANVTAELVELRNFFRHSSKFGDSQKYVAMCTEKLIENYYSEGKYLKVYKLIKETDIDENVLRNELENEFPNIKIYMAQRGELVEFGQYEQDGNLENGPEPLTWIVLETQGEKKLIISECAIEAYPMSLDTNDVTWSESLLYSVMNETMYYTMFDENQRSIVLKTKLSDTENLKYRTKSEHDEAFVFCLSAEEMEEYYSTTKNDASEFDKNGLPVVYKGGANCKAIHTQYMVTRGVTESTGYWLRTPGIDYDGTMVVNENGIINYEGDGNININLIRPAVWIDVSSLYDDNMGEKFE